MYGERGWKHFTEHERRLLAPVEEPTRLERFLNRFAWVAVILFTGFVAGYTLAFHHFAK